MIYKKIQRRILYFRREKMIYKKFNDYPFASSIELKFGDSNRKGDPTCL